MDRSSELTREQVVELLTVYNNMPQDNMNTKAADELVEMNMLVKSTGLERYLILPTAMMTAYMLK